MKRCVLVGLALALCPAGWSQYQSVPFEQIAGPNRSINDPQARLSASVPLGWTLRRAGRSEKGEISIMFGSAKTPAAVPNLYYLINETSRAPLPGDVEAMLRGG